MNSIASPYQHAGRTSVAAPAKQAHVRDMASDWIVYAPLLATTVLSKFSVPALASRGLGVGLPVIFSVLLLGIGLNRVRFHGGRLCFFSLLMVTLGGMQLFHVHFSAKSFLFMAAVCFSYTLVVPRKNDRFPAAADVFLNVALFLSVCGIAQFLLQFVVGKQYAYPIENFTPKGFLVQGFNYLNALGFNSSIYKANGFFMLEPSFFSQLLAIGIVTELVTYQRMWRLVVLALGMIFSYSGTGILILACGLPVAMLTNRRLDFLLAFIGIAILCVVFAEQLRLDVFLNRMGEFSAGSGSSASIRFLSWIPLFKDKVFIDSIHALIGYGAGNFAFVASDTSELVAEMMHSKIFIEYGLIGGALYIGFLFYCIFSATAPVAVKVVVMVLHFMSGAYAEPVVGIALSLLLLTPPVPPQTRRGTLAAEGEAVRNVGVPNIGQQG